MATMAKTTAEESDRAGRPSVIVIMADDLGFSDVGCFGGEIETPNIDQLAADGVIFSQMYNCARCCPSRASLLTGLYPHQAGIGHMVHEYSPDKSAAYQGYLRDSCATIAELLRDVGGYRTMMSGKWHVGGDFPPDDPKHWKKHAGDEHHPTPVQRGFDEHFGTLGGGGSYYDPPTLIHNEKLILDTADDFYYTDRINDEACRMIREAAQEKDKPFFLYVAHAAPHWPLHAPADVIAKYRGKYREGWDAARQRRHERLVKKGIIKKEWKCSPRDENSLPWEEAENKDWEDARMATYAAQVDIMDQGIGRIMQTLKDCKIDDRTMTIFLSDNGGCAEFLREDGGEGDSWCENYATISSDGTQTVVGNNPNVMPGDRSTFMSYDLSWANLSNTPFRLFKSWVHEGGISTPFCAHWPGQIKNPGRIHSKPWIMLDLAATIYEVAGVEYPTHYKGKMIPPLEGESFLRVLHSSKHNNWSRQRPIFWEHQGNRAVRLGRWKLVNRHGNDWELFDMDFDRTELNNLAEGEEDRVKSMIDMWEKWAERCEVEPWPPIPIEEGERDWAHFPWLW